MSNKSLNPIIPKRALSPIVERMPRPEGIDHQWANEMAEKWYEIYCEFKAKVAALEAEIGSDKMEIVIVGDYPMDDLAIRFK